MTGHGIITKCEGGLYTVLLPDENSFVTCRARGIFRHEGLTPLPGDTAMLEGEGEETVIGGVGERKNHLVRPALANLTHIFVVIPAARPEPDLLCADKLIGIAENGGITPVVVINKADTAPERAAEIEHIYRTGGFEVFALSSLTGEGVEALGAYIAEHADTMIAAFAGASGAGKSTLMSRLFPELKLKTGEISLRTRRGRHTTRCVSLFDFNYGGSLCLIADTPGFSMLDFTEFNFITESELPYAFREFSDCLGKCRYTKCTHLKEEGCAVLEAVEAGRISSSRHASYVAMREEIRKKPQWKRDREERT